MLNVSRKSIVERVERRAKELDMTMRALSLAAGAGPDLIRDWKRDKSPLPRLDSIARVAEILGVPAGWLAFGEGDNRIAHNDNIRRVPVISWVAAGRFADSTMAIEEEADFIDVSGLGNGRFFGLRILGDSMNRIAPEGSTIVVDPQDRALVPRKFFVFQNANGATFKRYMADPVRLEPFSHNLMHEAVQIDSETEVLGRAVRVLFEQEI